MTCASCAKAVERSVGKIDGVQKLMLILQQKKHHISYIPEKVKLLR